MLPLVLVHDTHHFTPLSAHHCVLQDITHILYDMCSCLRYTIYVLGET